MSFTEVLSHIEARLHQLITTPEMWSTGSFENIELQAVQLLEVAHVAAGAHAKTAYGVMFRYRKHLASSAFGCNWMNQSSERKTSPELCLVLKKFLATEWTAIMLQGTPNEKELSITDIGDADLYRLAAQIRPVCIPEGKKKLRWLENVPFDMRRSSFLWDAKPGKKAKGLIPVATVRTLHTYGFYGLFKPSLAEVYAEVNRLPRDVQDQVVAFCLTGPVDVEDLNLEKAALYKGYHVAHVDLYRAV